MSGPVYRRVIVKLSGEALSGEQDFGIEQATVERIADVLVELCAVKYDESFPYGPRPTRARKRRARRA